MALVNVLAICSVLIIQGFCHRGLEDSNISKWNEEKESFKKQQTTHHRIWKSFSSGNASNRRIASLYSRTGKFLEILPSGRMRGTSNAKSKDTQLEVQTYGIRYRRFKRRNSPTYLAIGKYGKPYTTTTPTSDTLFKAFHERNGWIRYQSVKYGWVIAIKKNGRMKKAARPSVKNGNSHKSMQFLTLFAEKIPWKKHHTVI